MGELKRKAAQGNPLPLKMLLKTKEVGIISKQSEVDNLYQTAGRNCI